MEWKSLDRCVLKFRLVPSYSSRAMQTHLRWKTSTRHRSLESHLLITSSPTRCKLPLPIVQATQAAKSSDFGDSHIFECQLWVISGQTDLGQSPTLGRELIHRRQRPLPGSPSW